MKIFFYRFILPFTVLSYLLPCYLTFCRFVYYSYIQLSIYRKVFAAPRRGLLAAEAATAGGLIAEASLAAASASSAALASVSSSAVVVAIVVVVVAALAPAS
jgi:hypothetical protein